MATEGGSLDLFRYDARGGISGPAAGAPAEELGRASGEPGSAAEPWTVAQVNRRARLLLEHGMSSLWVAGEVGSWRRTAAGHRYFTLKDETAHIGAVMFASDARRLPADPEDGTRVRAFGSVTLYEARGRYQLRVRRLTAEDGEGLWRRAFEKVRRKLQAEGLMDPARRRPVPACPACVGVVTSATGAALHDILSVIGSRAPWTRVLLRDARVQGEGAAEDVARAIDEIGRSGRADVVLVGRGGGSLEDLWAFNREEVARAIAACPVPVVSAVGHEVDVTIADLVADLRAPTPSAGAEAVVPDRAVLARRLADLRPAPVHRPPALCAPLRRPPGDPRRTAPPGYSRRHRAADRPGARPRRTAGEGDARPTRLPARPTGKRFRTPGCAIAAGHPQPRVRGAARPFGPGAQEHRRVPAWVRVRPARGRRPGRMPRDGDPARRACRRRDRSPRGHRTGAALMDEPARPERDPAPPRQDTGDRQPMSVEERLRRLDRIVAALDAEDVELEQSLALFEEGIRHVRAAEQLLSAAELRVEELIEGEARRREDAG